MNEALQTENLKSETTVHCSDNAIFTDSFCVSLCYISKWLFCFFLFFLKKSLNHLLNWFIQYIDSFMTNTRDCLNEWLIESVTQLIHSKTLLHSQPKLMTAFQWVIHWIIYLTDSSRWLNHSFMTKTNDSLKLRSHLSLFGEFLMVKGF